MSKLNQLLPYFNRETAHKIKKTLEEKEKTKAINNKHIEYMEEIEKWWKNLSENDKMDVYDNMVDFLK